MKKKKILIAFIVSMLLILPVTVSAAHGIWKSAWGYDVNGLSGIGATNAMESGYNFQFQVRGAGGVILSHTTKKIGAHQQYRTTHKSAALQQKQGQVSASSQVYFTPYFNP